MPPKSDIEILSQYVDDENGYCRLRVGRRVHYLTFSTDVFDEDTLCRPYLLIPRILDLPDSAWTTMTLSRDEDGSLTSAISTDPLPEIRITWHELRIDLLDLERTRRFRSGVHEVQYGGVPAIAKIACFDWDIARIERETWAVIGFLLQRVEGEPACTDDLANCEALVRRMHRLGLIHDDVNRYNFLVDRVSRGGARLTDFEHVEEFDEVLARAELLSSPAELAEEIGRGATRWEAGSY
ncbi:hypothetical protein F5Y13DRAFT_188964 [Hypoxylon sp. FL1857]|nr:hypothetical protein F5Y13DRAFT_188964 [Hypoxylon sp. FL1857]